MLPPALVQSVTVSSSFTPDVTYDPRNQAAGSAPAAGPGQGLAGAILSVIRPSVVAQTALGPLVIQPYGPPQPYGVLAAGVLAVIGGVVLVLAVRGIKA